MTHEIYLDANATSPTCSAAISAAIEALGARFGNPSSSHAAGLKAKALLDAVRFRARLLLGAGEGRLTFTSGATEGIQTAVLSALCDIRARQRRGEAVGDLLVYGATEHKAVPECLAHWNELLGTGLRLHPLAVDATGRHRLDLLREVAPCAALVCTMAANNETGVVSDLAAIEALLAERAPAALWLVDSVQALGKLRLDLAATRIDYAPFSGHKLYAPKGVGMLYVRAGAPYTPLMVGGGQEGGLRSGTENMAGIAALGAVLEAMEEGGAFRPHDELAAFRQRLADALRAAFPGIVFNMPFAHSLPTTLNFSVEGLAGKELLDVFDAAGVRVSSGSACSSSKAAPSYVLEAMGLPAWRTSAAVRMSFGPMVDEALIDTACDRIARCGAALRKSGLLPCAPVQPDDGVTQLCADGQCSYLVVDAQSRACVVIDPVDSHFGRIASLVRSQGLRVLAVLATATQREQTAASLRDQLGVNPAAAVRIALGDGSQADAFALGGRWLARLPGGAGGYLLGESSGAALAPSHVRFAFIPGDSAPCALLVDPATVLCRASDPHNMLCGTVGADGPIAVDTSALELTPATLESFLLAHPGARLVDVREAWEHAAGATGWHGRAAESVPLSRLPQKIAEWLSGEPAPLVFFCRSGNRSARAAGCLYRLGYRNVRHLAGGLALAG